MMKIMTAVAAIFNALAVLSSETPFVFVGPTVTNVADGVLWCETAMTDVVIRAGSALDLSGLDDGVTAGGYGWARPAADGSLRFEGRPGEKVRLFGCVEGNISLLTMIRDCKTKEEKHAAFDAFALQAKRQGFNFIRPHGLLDTCFNIRTFQSSGVMTPEHLDDVDYFAFACKQNGIYVYIDLAAYGLRDPQKRKPLWQKAGVMVKDPVYWELWRTCSEEILNHVNPYTGLAWKDDPAIMGVMEYNEQATGAKIAVWGEWKGLPPELQNAYLKGWGDWMAVNSEVKATPSAPIGFYGKDVRGKYLHRYLSELFMERALDCNEVTRGTGYKGLLTTYNSDVDIGACAARWRTCDAVPYNFHFGHPDGGGNNNTGSVVSQRDSILSTSSGSDFCYGNRIKLADRPYIVTEYSHAFWNRRRYEAAILMPSYAALNAYAGIHWHEGGSDTKAVGQWPRNCIDVFKISTSPAMRAATFLAACLYRRGDVKEATHTVNVAMSDKYWKAHTENAPSTSQARIGLMVKYGLTFPELKRPDSVKAPLKADLTITPGSGDEIEDGLWVSNVKEKESKDFDLDAFTAKLKNRGLLPKDNLSSPKDGIYQSETGELTMYGNEHVLKVVTPRTEAVAAPAGMLHGLGLFTLATSTEDCCAALTSVDGKPLAESRRMVFLWITRESNTGMITSGDGKTLVKKGGYPALWKLGKVAFKAKVSDPGAFKMYLLDYSGARLEGVPVSVCDGELVCSLDTAKLAHSPTPFFELVADPSSKPWWKLW